MATRAEMIQLAARLRREGSTWPEIATQLLSRNSSLNARSAHRLAHGWSQQKVADEWCRQWPDEPITDKHVSWWECWPVSGHAPSLGTLGRLAEIYQCDLSDLVADLSCYRSLDDARTTDDRSSEVKRRQFIGGAVALTAASAIDRAPAMNDEVRRLGARDVGRLRDVVRSLDQAEAHKGGGAVYDDALREARHIQDLLDTSTYSGPVGRDLHVVMGYLTEMAAWCAFDAGRHNQARRLWTESLLAAQITENDPLAVEAMATMTLQALQLGHPNQSLDLIDTAQRRARPFGTPRLMSMLASREARAYALLRDTGRCHAALLRSEQLLEQHENDPDWLAFWGPADFWSATARTHLDLGAPGQAVNASRRAIEATEPSFPRNRALYLAGLARALASIDEIDEATATATEAMGSLPAVTSARLRNNLRAVADELAPRSSHPAVEAYVHDLNVALAA